MFLHCSWFFLFCSQKCKTRKLTTLISVCLPLQFVYSYVSVTNEGRGFYVLRVITEHYFPALNLKQSVFTSSFAVAVLKTCCPSVFNIIHLSCARSTVHTPFPSLPLQLPSGSDAPVKNFKHCFYFVPPARHCSAEPCQVQCGNDKHPLYPSSEVPAPLSHGRDSPTF